VRRLIPLAGLLAALVTPTVLPAIASADSGDSTGLCAEAYEGYNRTTRTFLADFESPQKDTPKHQFEWVRAARNSGAAFTATIAGGSSVNTGGSGYKTYCTWSTHYDKSTGFGSGEDYLEIHGVVYNEESYPGNYHPTAYGSYYSHTYWRADSNGATGDFDVPMPFASGWTSNYSQPKP
jgi:hypothetical protein